MAKLTKEQREALQRARDFGNVWFTKPNGGALSAKNSRFALANRLREIGLLSGNQITDAGIAELGK